MPQPGYPEVGLLLCYWQLITIREQQFIRRVRLQRPLHLRVNQRAAGQTNKQIRSVRNGGMQ